MAIFEIMAINSKRSYLIRSLFRVWVVFCLGLVSYGAVAYRLVSIQIIHRESYRERAERQYQNRIDLKPHRGIISDRNGERLALNLPDCYAVGAHPPKIKDPKLLSQKLAQLLGSSPGYVLARLSSPSPFVWITRRADQAQGEEIASWGEEGLSLFREAQRTYPYGKIGAQVVGFTDVDSRGLSGIEVTYDRLLQGSPGWMILQSDGLGRQNPRPDFPQKKATDGGHVALTLDVVIQTILEEELKWVVKKFGAPKCMGLVTNPQTGEILAMASGPTFDPNRPGDFPPQARKNKVITDIFEPGSTFKIVTIAAALAESRVTEKDIFFCENGRYRVGEAVIRDAHRGGYGWLTLGRILGYSSNIGVIKMAQGLGRATLYQYSRRFGFGSKTDLDLVGEVRGILLEPNQWTPLTLAQVAIGQGVSVTALQLAMAYGAVANGGFLLKPRLIKAIRDDHGIPQTFEGPEVVRRVIPRQVAAQLTKFLEGAILEGTGKSAQVPGLRIAGKTGTAQKVDPLQGGYSETEFVASFVGFFPVEEPTILIEVVVESPRGEHLGSKVAAPVFRRIAERIWRTPSFQPYQGEELAGGEDYGGERHGGKALAVQDLPLKEVIRILEEGGIPYRMEGQGDWVVYQLPQPGCSLGPGEELALTIRPASSFIEGLRRVPNLKGLSIRAAINRLAVDRLDFRLTGSGVVVGQVPPPGTRVLAGATCRLICRSDGQ